MTKSDKKNFKYAVINLLEKHIVQMKGGAGIIDNITLMDRAYLEITKKTSRNLVQSYYLFYRNYNKIIDSMIKTNISSDENAANKILELLRKKMKIDESFLTSPDRQTISSAISDAKIFADSSDIELSAKLLNYYFQKLSDDLRILELLKQNERNDILSKINKNFDNYFKLYYSLLIKNVDNNTDKRRALMEIIMNQKKEIDSLYRIYSSQIISNTNIQKFRNKKSSYNLSPIENTKRLATNLITNINRSKYIEYQKRQQIYNNELKRLENELKMQPSSVQSSALLTNELEKLEEKFRKQSTNNGSGIGKLSLPIVGTGLTNAQAISELEKYEEY